MELLGKYTKIDKITHILGRSRMSKLTIPKGQIKEPPTTVDIIIMNYQ